MWIDIDLFTDAEYGSIDFDAIDNFLLATFKYVNSHFGTLPGMGRSYLVSMDKENTVKLDIYYSMDRFIQPPLLVDGIRFATIEDIIAMKAMLY